MCMRVKRVMAALIVFGSLSFMPLAVKAEPLPVIVKWEDGSGYDADGQKIAGTWAYDSVNKEGKYVQFDEAGTVRQKAENPGAGDLEENYTPTEQEPAQISLRAEAFEGFDGTVLVTLAEAGGITKQCELTPKNHYGCNVPVSSGVYAIQSVEAYDGSFLYEAVYPTEQHTLSIQETILLKIQITGEVTGRVAAVSRPRQEDNRAEKQEEIKEERGNQKVDSMKQRWVLYVGAAGLVVLLAGGLLRHKKKNRYD